MKCIEIKRADLTGVRERVTCGRILRDIPGLRTVCAGTWGERAAVVKVFRSWKGRRHMRREWRGLKELEARGLTAPKGLFLGRTVDGGWALVTEEIGKAQSLLERFVGADEAAWEAAAELALRYVAAMHEAKVIQEDLHAGNFLVCRETVYALDPARMRFLRGPVSIRRRLQNLAVLFCAMGGRGQSQAQAFLRRYFEALGRGCGEEEERKFDAYVQVQSAKMLENSLGKTMRNCTRFVQVKKGNIRGMFRRDVWEEAAESVEQLDAMMETGEFLKRGNTCTVCRVRIGTRDAVIKRYNFKGWGHALRHTLKGSRARRCWQHGYRLVYSGVPTPLPLGFVEVTAGPVVKQSYLICEYVEGVSLREYLLEADAAKRKSAIQKAQGLIEQLARHGVSHGDLKLTNFIVRDGEPVLIDLDSMRVHRFRRSLRHACEYMQSDFQARVRHALKQPSSMNLPSIEPTTHPT